MLIVLEGKRKGVQPIGLTVGKLPLLCRALDVVNLETHVVRVDAMWGGVTIKRRQRNMS